MATPIEYLDVDTLAGGTAVITIDFYDEDGNAVTPNTATWTLRKAKTGEIINSREDVSISPLDTSVDVVLSGSDLVEGRSRLYADWTYDSAAGNDLPGRSICEFKIERWE